MASPGGACARTRGAKARAAAAAPAPVIAFRREMLCCATIGLPGNPPPHASCPRETSHHRSGGRGLIRNMLVGIIGSFVGGALVRYELLQLPAAMTNVTNAVPYGTQIVISTIGAAIVIIIARFLGGR